METQDYYSILGIDRNASGDEVKWAYRRLAQRFHPDVTDDPDGECKFKAVAEAYRTLKRAESRTAYDHRALPGYDEGGLAWEANPLHLWYTLFPWPGWIWFWAR